MKYTHILNYVASTPWAILPEKMQEIVSILAFRAAGHTFTPEEIQARIGASSRREELPPRIYAAGDGRNPSKGSGVAGISIRGVIAHRMGGMDDMSGGTSAERIGAMLKHVAADDSIGTIIYDIDSPGGTVPGVQELASQMFALRGQKKQIAQVNDLAASAAYWLASQADEIVSIPSGTAGSIGVFTVHQDLSEALAKEGIKIDVIKAGKYKVEGNPFEPLSEEGRAFIQARVDEAYGQFVKDVARGRGVNVSDVKGGYGEGRALSAKDALKAGLIDRIATFDETLSLVTGKRSAGMRAECDVTDFTDGEFVVGLGGPDQEADRLRRLERF
jgi:signal peptide peptidase SppA